MNRDEVLQKIRDRLKTLHDEMVSLMERYVAEKNDLCWNCATKARERWEAVYFLALDIGFSKEELIDEKTSLPRFHEYLRIVNQASPYRSLG